MTNRTAKHRAAPTVAPKAQQKGSNRNTILVIGVVALVVIGIVIAAVTVGGSSSKTATPDSVPTGQAATAIIDQVTSVPATVIDAVGAGAITAAPKPLTAAPLTNNGKPEVLYIGAEFCPFCAGERWAIVNALSRFGTFSNLSLTHSATGDVFPNTQTFTFHKSSYTSDYLVFSTVEVSSNQPSSSGGYIPLETPTAEQQTVWAAADPNQSFPFMDIGGKYVVSGASYDVGVIHGQTAAQIAGDLSNASSSTAKSVIGTANVLTAAICSITGNQPAAVCTAPGVVTAATKLG